MLEFELLGFIVEREGVLFFLENETGFVVKVRLVFIDFCFNLLSSVILVEAGSGGFGGSLVLFVGLADLVVSVNCDFGEPKVLFEGHASVFTTFIFFGFVVNEEVVVIVVLFVSAPALLNFYSILICIGTLA